MLSLLVSLDARIQLMIFQGVYGSWWHRSRLSHFVELIRPANTVERGRSLVGPGQHDALVGTGLALSSHQASLSFVGVLEAAELLKRLLRLLELILTLLLFAHLLITFA